MNCNPAVSDFAANIQDRVRPVLQGVLRAAARDWPDEALSAATGIPARTIKSYRLEGKEPGLANALALCCVIGPRALNTLLALIGYVAQPLEEAETVNVAQLIADLLPDVATIASAAADGRIDHTEADNCRRAADHIIETVLPLASAGAAA